MIIPVDITQLDGLLRESNDLCDDYLIIAFQFQRIVITLITALQDGIAISIRHVEGTLPDHTIIIAIAIEHKTVHIEILRVQFCIPVYGNFTTLPGADNHLTQPAAVVVTATAGT